MIPAVLMAGGSGTRLRPLSLNRPKPLVEVAGRPMIDHVLAWLADHGCSDVTIALGHESDGVAEHVIAGWRSVLKLSTVVEPGPLGTVGAVGLLPDASESVLLVNVDTLTDLDPGLLVEFHRQNEADMTLATTGMGVPCAYGVVERSEDGAITAYREKPDLSIEIAMGISVLGPTALSHLKRSAGTRCDVPDLVRALREADANVVGYTHSGNWFDLGTPAELERAETHLRGRVQPF